jgi:Flp pilus assembly protein TadD
VGYYTRGKELQKQGELAAALDDFNKTIGLGPPMPEAYLERGVTLVLLGKEAEAEKDFEQCVKIEPRMKAAVENRRAEAKKEAGKKSP